MLYKTILLNKANGVATITLNRPEKLNPMNLQVGEELADAFEEVAADRAVRSVVLTGAGRGFCAGVDLSSSALERAREDPDTGNRMAKRLILPLRAMEKPVIVAVNGCAMGGGLSLALAGDIIIASDKATFGAVQLRLGLLPDLGATFLLPQRVGAATAFDLAFNYKIIDAAEALRIGLVDRVVPHDQLEAVVTDVAGSLAKGPTLAIGVTKKMIYKETSLALESALEEEMAAMRCLMGSSDFREGLQALREKRPPVFRGE